MKTYLVIFTHTTEHYNAESFFDLIKELREYCDLNETAIKQVILL